MTELALLTRAFETVPEPGDATVFEARSALLRAIAAVENGAAPRNLQEPQRRLALLLPRTAPRFRLALILIVLLLLLAGIATATYLGVRDWASAGPRGIQYRSSYRLATIFTSSPGGAAWWKGAALGPGGHDLYLIRPRSAKPELVRITGIDSGTGLHESRVLDFESLKVPRMCMWSLVRPLSVAANGDVFLVVGGLDLSSATSSATSRGCVASRLVVLHPGGSRQTILAGRALRSQPFPDGMELQIAASASNRVWLWADPAAGMGPQRLFEVIDPNADGDWSDRIVRTIGLPAFLPFAKSKEGRPDFYPQWQWQLAAEPWLPGDDRSRSIVVSTSNIWGRDFRVYRISDRNDDGDALDPGEVRSLLERRSNGGQIASRVVVSNGVVHRELVVAGLSHWDRVSLVSRPGTVRDVARAFRGLRTVLAGPKGRLYAITANDDGNGFTWVLYRLEPAGDGGGSVTVGSPVGSGAPPTVSFPPSRPGGAARLEFARADGESFTIGADGHDLRRLGSHVTCQSVDGRAAAYTADIEVPTEFFTYVATDGAQPQKVAERDDQVVCPFSRRWLLLYRNLRYLPTPAGSLIRLDLRTGRETVVVPEVDNRFALSPDGTKLVYVRKGREKLELLDLNTLRRHSLAAPLAGTGYTYGTVGESGGQWTSDWPNPFDLRWSPDGKQIAYAVAPLPRGTLLMPIRRRFVLWVRDVATGQALFRRSIVGGRPSLAWSADGMRLLVCRSDLSFEAGCPAGPGDSFAFRSYAAGAPQTPGHLFLIDLRSGSVRAVAEGPLIFAGWAPAGSTFAFATPRLLFVVGADGKTRRQQLPTRQSSVGERWLGWSPDGRYIGLDVGWEKTANPFEVVDVRTGQVHVLRPFGHPVYGGLRWWR